MIIITPAVLTNNLEDFQQIVTRFRQHFNSIDIDVADENFSGHKTLAVDELQPQLRELALLDISLHLMVTTPERVLEYLKSDFSEQNFRIYFHQESDLSFLENFKMPENWEKCIAIKSESNLKDQGFYTQFTEIQIMTVEIGSQGGDFREEPLEKINDLREMGYKGFIAVDGGVNLKTSSIIKKYKPDRVNVGSYSVQSKDLARDKAALELALNGN
jgi:ribulose-phosphate 3-epimerase